MTLPHGSECSAVCSRGARPVLLNSAGSMRLLTNGALNVICRPALQAGEAKAVKSPASIAAVGTNAMMSRWILADRRALVAAEEKQFVLR